MIVRTVSVLPSTLSFIVTGGRPRTAVALLLTCELLSGRARTHRAAALHLPNGAPFDQLGLRGRCWLSSLVARRERRDAGRGPLNGAAAPQETPRVPIGGGPEPQRRPQPTAAGRLWILPATERVPSKDAGSTSLREYRPRAIAARWRYRRDRARLQAAQTVGSAHTRQRCCVGSAPSRPRKDLFRSSRTLLPGSRRPEGHRPSDPKVKGQTVAAATLPNGAPFDRLHQGHVLRSAGRIPRGLLHRLEAIAAHYRPPPAHAVGAAAAPLTLLLPLHPTVGLAMRANQGSPLTQGGRCRSGCEPPRQGRGVATDNGFPVCAAARGLVMVGRALPVPRRGRDGSPAQRRSLARPPLHQARRPPSAGGARVATANFVVPG